MSNGIYVSMAGAAARSEQLDALSDNLSNIQTPGFRATKVAFQSFLATAGVTDKIFPAAVSSGLDMKPGQLVVTENPMDVAPDGMTFMGVQTNAGLAYTRNGALQVSNGTLVSGGLPVAEYTALQMKKAVVGHGLATKSQVQEMVKRLLRLPALPGKDAADALGLAISHAHAGASIAALGKVSAVQPRQHAQYRKGRTY